MKNVFLFLLLFPFWLQAQDEEKYLQGAVSLTDGQVVFQKELTNNALSSQQIFLAVRDWMKERFSREGCHLVYENEAKGELAAIGEEYIVFSRTALALDRARMRYQFTAVIDGHSCDVQLKNIRYRYDVPYQREPEEYEAEEWITDEHAIYKGKLNRISGKFRRKTIDFADSLFIGVSGAMGLAQTSAPATALPQQVPPEPVAPSAQEPAPREGYQTFTLAKLPEIMKSMLSGSSCVLEKDGQGQAVTWKGFGSMFGKDLASFALEKGSLSLKDGDTFTLSFSQPDGKADNWLLIECRKSGETADGDSIVVMGEILGIWVK